MTVIGQDFALKALCPRARLHERQVREEPAFEASSRTQHES